MQNRLELGALREQIDAVDDQLISLLGDRFRLTREVGHLKREAKIAPVDDGRESAVFRRTAALAEERRLNPELVLTIYRAILDEVVREHRAPQEL